MRAIPCSLLPFLLGIGSQKMRSDGRNVREVVFEDEVSLQVYSYDAGEQEPKSWLNQASLLVSQIFCFLRNQFLCQSLQIFLVFHVNHPVMMKYLLPVRQDSTTRRGLGVTIWTHKKR